jgi:hypothetical protein
VFPLFNWGDLVIIVTLFPPSAAVIAAVAPDNPLPITRTSVLIDELMK